MDGRDTEDSIQISLEKEEEKGGIVDCSGSGGMELVAVAKAEVAVTAVLGRHTEKRRNFKI